MTDTTNEQTPPIHEVEGFSVLGMASAPEPAKDLNPQARRDAAYYGTYAWKGRTFAGLSSGKKDVWGAMNHRLGYATLQQCVGDMTLFTPLAKTMLFVCLADWRELARLRALGITAVIAAYDEWLEASIPIHDEAAAHDLAVSILNDSVVTQAEAVDSPTDEPGKR